MDLDKDNSRLTFSNFSDEVDDGVIFDTNCNDPKLDIEDANFLAALVNYSPTFDPNTDGEITQEELNKISHSLINIFKEDPKVVEASS